MEDLVQQIRAFVAERDWERYHSPKNLSMALATEAAEILEIFRWLSEKESANLTDEQRDHLADEIGDVMINLANLASKFDIDPLAAAKRKLTKVKAKYPAGLTPQKPKQE